MKRREAMVAETTRGRRPGSHVGARSEPSPLVAPDHGRECAERCRSRAFGRTLGTSRTLIGRLRGSERPGFGPGARCCPSGGDQAALLSSSGDLAHARSPCRRSDTALSVRGGNRGPEGGLRASRRLVLWTAPRTSPPLAAETTEVTSVHCPKTSDFKRSDAGATAVGQE